VRIHQTRPVTAAIIAALRAEGLAVGNAEQPPGSGWQNTPGTSTHVAYVVVYPLAGGSLDGSLADGQEDAEALYQLTCVGASAEQAEWVADAARASLLGASLTVPGRSVPLIIIDTLGGSVRDDNTQPPVWWIADRYSVRTTPTT
jgi:hypothetical protein